MALASDLIVVHDTLFFWAIFLPVYCRKNQANFLHAVSHGQQERNYVSEYKPKSDQT